MAGSADDPPPYAPDDVRARLREQGLDGWRLEGDRLTRRYETDGWPQTLMAVNAIGFICEAAWHHADLALSWGSLTVELTTHSSGGVTDRDLALARRIDELLAWRPEAGSPLPGTSKRFVAPAEPG